MNIEHCSFLHHTSMKRKMTSIFAKLIKGEKLNFFERQKRKEIGKLLKTTKKQNMTATSEKPLQRIYNILKTCSVEESEN